MDDDKNNTSIFSGKIIGNKFKLEDKIGQGSFGMIYKCIHIETQESCAIKLEKRVQNRSSMLVIEIKVMMEVKNEVGFPKLIGYGKEEDYNYVAMTYLGRNLDSLQKKCGGKFSISTVINVFKQCVTRLESLHQRNLIHRDIKPENFVIGYGSNFMTIHSIDFGLAKYFIDQEGSMIGTARYASLSAHLGYEQSRRDDLEGLGYVIVFLAKGKVPWQQIHADSKEEKYEKIKQMKKSLSFATLCENLPKQFEEYFQYIRKLEFTDKPDYQYIYKLFSDMQASLKSSNISRVDWKVYPEYRNKVKKQEKLDKESKQECRLSNLLLIPGQNDDKASQQPSITTTQCNTTKIIQFNSNLSKIEDSSNKLLQSPSNFMVSINKNEEQKVDNQEDEFSENIKTKYHQIDRVSQEINILKVRKSYKNKFD